MKNPNGFGTVTKLKGRRRKPWVVKVTIGYSDEGKQLQKSIGTFANRSEAMKHLAKYNSSNEMQKKYGLQNDVHTLGECMMGIIERDKDRKSQSWYNTKIWCYNLLSEIVNEDIKELNLTRLQKAFDNLKDQGKTQVTLGKCRVTVGAAFKYAIIHQWISKDDDFSMYIDINTKNNERKTIHYPFSREEINILMNQQDFFAKVILVYILTGCRASELLRINELNDTYFICGLKTKNGKNRKIPIHPYIKPFIKEVLNYLSNAKYTFVQKKFLKYMKLLNMHHTMHDTRNTFATLAKEAGIDHRTIKKILGHSINDITEDVYIKESVEYLVQQIEKIKID